MNNYIVSARKYRPKSFERVVGQPSITQTLENAINNNQLAHAYLFCGPRGVGKTSCARIFAKAINKENDEDNRDFGFNIFELDAASNNKVDDIRQLIDQVRIQPQVGRYKVYIIDEVHMLSKAAFNAFLKTLEEPPPHAIFILATTEKHKILPTILSRCQIFDFNRISNEDIAGHLAYVAENEGVSIDQESLHLIAQKADGALRDALSIFDQIVSFNGLEVTYERVLESLNVLDYDYYFKITDLLRENDRAEIFLILDEIIRGGFEFHQLLSGLSQHFRDLLITKQEETLVLLDVSSSIKSKYRSQSEEVESKILLNGLHLINEAEMRLKNASNQRLLVELTLLKIANLFGKPAQKKRTEPSDQIGQSIEEEDAAKNPDPEIVEKAPKTEAKKNYSQAIVEEVRVVHEPEPEGLLDRKPLPPKIVKPKSSISLHDEKEDLSEVVPVSPIQEETDDSVSVEEDGLIQCWKAYAEMIKNQGKYSFYACMTARDPVLEDGRIIKIVLENKVQEENLIEEKLGLMDFLREQLQNQTLELEYTISEETKSQYLGPKDQLKKMAEKNPNLKDLVNQLDLELE